MTRCFAGVLAFFAGFGAVKLAHTIHATNYQCGWIYALTIVVVLPLWVIALEAVRDSS